MSRLPLDHELLDALDDHDRVSLSKIVWRVVLESRDPLSCFSSAGRWDPGHFDVLYTALEAGGALAEMHVHLSRQPVFPSRPFTLDEIQVETRNTLFLEKKDLIGLGVDLGSYSGFEYRRTQEIGEAALFLGFDGICAPSARWNGKNLILFCDQFGPEGFRLVTSSKAEWELRARVNTT